MPDWNSQAELTAEAGECRVVVQAQQYEYSRDTVYYSCLLQVDACASRTVLVRASWRLLCISFDVFIYGLIVGRSPRRWISTGLSSVARRSSHGRWYFHFRPLAPVPRVSSPAYPDLLLPRSLCSVLRSDWHVSHFAV